MRSLAGLGDRSYVKVLADPALNMLLDAYIKYSYYDIIYPMRSIKREIDKRIGEKGGSKVPPPIFRGLFRLGKNKKGKFAGDISTWREFEARPRHHSYHR